MNKEEETLTFQMIQNYLQEYDNASIQKQSFDFFIHHRLNKIIEEEPVITIPVNDQGQQYCIKFGQVFVDKPYIIDENRVVRYITPNEARLRDLSYNSTVSVNIRTSMVQGGHETDVKEFFKVMIAKIPMMIGTSKCNLYELNVEERKKKGECEYDNGGYFIVRGKERVLVSQERMNHNIVYVFEQKPSSKFLLVAEIRSMSEETGHSILLQMKINQDKHVVVQIPYVSQEIPLGYVFQAFQFTRKEVEYILQFSTKLSHEYGVIRKMIQGVLRDMDVIESSEKALQYIAQYALHNVTKERKLFYVNQILQNELFPHLGMTSRRRQKGFFMGHMFSKLVLTFVGHRPMDDRDHLNNKRIEVSGHLLAELFRTLFKRFVRTMGPQLMKRPDVMIVISKMNVITQGIKHCFSTGNWGIPKSSYIRTGVSQILSRLSYNAFLSHLRRILIPVGKEGKNTKIRQVHPSQIGFICPHETPEGHSAGIVKNMALAVQITPKVDTVYLRTVLEENPCLMPLSFEYQETHHEQYFKVFLNGIWIGITHQISLYNSLVTYKQQNRLPMSVSLFLQEKEHEIHVFGDEGRLMRPLWNARRLPSLEELKTKEFSDFLREQKVVFLDSNEIENKVIAMTFQEARQEPFYDYCELHPSLMMGLCVGLIPFAEHTQAPRITYHASMGKQAIGYYATTYQHRFDTLSHVLCYPEKPLVQTHYGEFMGCNQLSSGNNVIVAICTYTGFNQEDSVIFNQSAIDRGLFRSFSFRTILVEERKKSTSYSESIELPPNDIRMKSFNYTKLNDDGIVKVGCFVGSGDVIIGRVQTKLNKSCPHKKQDTSVVIKSGEEGYIDRIVCTISPDGYRLIKIKIRTLKIPEIGDKVASRSAQKGTIGMILRQEDMPFSSHGIIPDLIINPLCIPSRMTINQLIECLGAKSGALTSKFRYSTPFTSHSTDVVDSLRQELQKCGYECNGNERMFNGFTGEWFDSTIFIGPTFYHRLKHLVSAKIHARNHGSLQALTRQPLEGRSRDGGLRFGEMERDSTVDCSISLVCGISVMMTKMHKVGWRVLGWDTERKGIIDASQTAFLDKGEKPCVVLTLEDGRTFRCTPDHPMLTSEHKWVRAKDLCANQSRLKTSVHYPTVDVEEEVAECGGWGVKFGDLYLGTSDSSELLTTFAFVRILGWLVTDGTISKLPDGSHIGRVSLGHSIDVNSFLLDLELFCPIHQRSFACADANYNYYMVRIPWALLRNIVVIPGVIIGRKIDQPATLPEFIVDERCPRPIVREFLGAMFGGDGRTCHLAMHRGKRDLLTSVSFSKSRTVKHLVSLDKMMSDMIAMLTKCGITNVTIQNKKETSHSKIKHEDKGPTAEERCYQSTLHLDISELVTFWEKIGFRHCCQKSLRLEAAVAYKRLRNEVTRQHNWLVQRVDEITNFRQLKAKNPKKIIHTKSAIEQAVDELQNKEALVHAYAIPSTHDITDHLIKGTEFGKFTSKSFPTAEQFLEKVGALHWFVDVKEGTAYAVSRESNVLSTMDMTVIDVRPCPPEKVYDIEVERINSFLANGIVAHNCMISHGVSRFLTERLFDMSDKFDVPICSECGFMPNSLTLCNHCESQKIRRVALPYACKLLFQELQAVGIRINLFPTERSM